MKPVPFCLPTRDMLRWYRDLMLFGHRAESSAALTARAEKRSSGIPYLLLASRQTGYGEDYAEAQQYGYLLACRTAEPLFSARDPVQSGNCLHDDASSQVPESQVQGLRPPPRWVAGRRVSHPTSRPPYNHASILVAALDRG